jgi:hypothetical protein
VVVAVLVRTVGMRTFVRVRVLDAPVAVALPAESLVCGCAQLRHAEKATHDAVSLPRYLAT